jgi:predicted methyltransferase
MRQSLIPALLIALACGTGASVAVAQTDHSADASHAALQAAIDAPNRTPAFKERDAYRHPMETLAFFGIKPTDHVVELIPSAGWYTEILAPYLAEGGKLYAAANPGAGTDKFKEKLAADPVYRNVTVVGLMTASDEVPAASVDAVLTFRNMHNLTMRGDGNDVKVLAAAMKMLKPGGTLGIVEHRLPESHDIAREKTSGYLKTSTVRRIVEAAGFEYVGASEVNANPKDTTDYPKGVWTLPPNYAEGEATKAKYQAIGESDRMTLKFRKPAA